MAITRWHRILPISSIDDEWVKLKSNAVVNKCFNKIADKLEVDFYNEYNSVIENTIADISISLAEKHCTILAAVTRRVRCEATDRKGNVIKQGDIVLVTIMNKMTPCIITTFTKGGNLMYLPLSYIDWCYTHSTDKTPILNIQSFDEDRFLIINYDELTSFEKDIYELVCDKYTWVKQLCYDRARERALGI